MSKLYFRYGAMGSGKTIDLLKVAYNYKERNKCILLFFFKTMGLPPSLLHSNLGFCSF